MKDEAKATHSARGGWGWGNLFFRRWLVYGFLLSMLHAGAFCVFAMIIPRFDYVCNWLYLPGGWLHQSFDRKVVPQLPSALRIFYAQHVDWFYGVTWFSNSALWGFTLAGVVLFIGRKISNSRSTKQIH